MTTLQWLLGALGVGICVLGILAQRQESRRIGEIEALLDEADQEVANRERVS